MVEVVGGCGWGWMVGWRMVGERIGSDDFHDISSNTNYFERFSALEVEDQAANAPPVELLLTWFLTSKHSHQPF